MARSARRQIERLTGTYERALADRWINTATAHDAHHAKGRYNYGYYFLVWDRLMGTLDRQPGSKQSVRTASTAG